ncbi:MAG: Cytidylate kinase, partial [Chlamydiae bacterium]|nr:Cytidylate kinase [Chlamydiota bacterium]
MIITIDGPVGTGKSTIADLLAEKLGFVHFDTGAMYRCVTYGIIKHNIDPSDDEQLGQYLKTFDFDIQVSDGKKRYFFEGEDITETIRSEEVTALVSEVSAIRSVRDVLVKFQRKLGSDADAVFEGRDMGTVVFPQAELKIFLTADPKVRASRRHKELREKFPEETLDITVDDVLENLNRRDSIDSTREISPLKQADDAHIVDSSNLTTEEVLDRILQIKSEFS